MAAAASFSLAACDSDSGNGSGARPGQALATVNGADVTIHQVNAELSGLTGQGGTEPGALQKRALESVINRELLATQAIQAKLDRDPAIMMAIERSRSQILAQAYLQSRTSQLHPTTAEIDEYVAQHPELFSLRKIYDLHFLALPAGGVTTEVTAMTEQARSLDALAANLEARKIAFTSGRSYRSSAELPAQLLAKMDQISKQPVFILRDGEQALLASLAYVKDDPVTGTTARKQAEQFLSNSKAIARIQDEVAQLRRAATISYTQGSSTPLPAPAPANAGEPGKAARAALENGVSGLR